MRRLLDAALQAATGLAQLLRFRGACATAESAAEREAATACLLNAEAELTNAAEAVSGLLELAKNQRRGRPHRRLRPELNEQRPALEHARRVLERRGAASGPRPTVACHERNR